ncbi:hypothetical protein J3E74DRAFT_374043 [Bipolaris maydis]|nr:hypothetical protein J3E74DRAFT_374043 [Bipolaris maydis]KAJ6283930.1 hypothetical protein J3E71DRAFT_274577 [Bipolaris maydis]
MRPLIQPCACFLMLFLPCYFGSVRNFCFYFPFPFLPLSLSVFVLECLTARAKIPFDNFLLFQLRTIPAPRGGCSFFLWLLEKDEEEV